MTREFFTVPGLRVISQRIHGDSRGTFSELWNRSELADFGLHAEFVQQNLSVSTRHVLRGLHAQGKLLRVISGKIFDVVVDLRRSSPAFGGYTTRQLSDSVPESIWIPEGCAHGFLALSDNTQVLYAVTTPRSPHNERTIAWNDSTLNIPWPLAEGEQPVLSSKDRSGLRFVDADTFA
jgi:dTDP-4-dehydrorhamnose 3,5-epimerase